MADGPLTNLANLRGRTDANGYLLVTISGGAISPATVKTDSLTLNVASADIVLWRQAAKTLQIDTDGAGGALTLTAIKGPLTITGLFTGTTQSLSGKTTTYNGVATAGQGVPSIYGEALSAAVTTGATLLSYTPPATAGRYRVNGTLTTTSGTNTGTVQLTLDYKDSQGTTHTADIMSVMNAAGAIAVTGTAASKEFHALPWEITIDNTATAIVVKSVTTGSVNYTGSASVEQIA